MFNLLEREKEKEILRNVKESMKSDVNFCGYPNHLIIISNCEFIYVIIIITIIAH